MRRFWMVRAGRGSKLAQLFERKGVVAIGWNRGGDFSSLDTLEAMRARIASAYAGETPQQRTTSLAQANKFRNMMEKGDRIVTYDGESKEYLIGSVRGAYEYRPDMVKEHPHVREVQWEGRIPKAALRRPTVNTLGAIMTVFEPGEDVLLDLETALRTGRVESPDGDKGKAEEDSLPDFNEVFPEFVAGYLRDDVGEAHKSLYQAAKIEGRRNYEEIVARADRGEDTTDSVLDRLLPHANTERHRKEGQWIHTAPAITKHIRAWYEGAGLVKPEEWPAKAAHILRFIRRAVDHPSQLPQACDEFFQSPLAKGFQSGMLSPILNALRPDEFAIVNSKVVKAYQAFTGITITPSLAEYPETNNAVITFVRQHSEPLQTAAADGLSPLDAFDMMAHWYVAVRDPDGGELTTGALEPVRGPVNREESGDARRVLEAVCPDPAPRAVALDALARSIRCAHSLSSSAWSITLRPNVVRLNVSGIMALDIASSGLYLVVDGTTLDGGARAAVETFDAGDYKYVPSAVGYALPYDELEPAITLLRPAHEELMRLAINKSSRATWRSAHSPGVLQMLREAGHDVPDPGYYANQHPAAPGLRVGEGNPPALPLRSSHEIFSLEQAATDTYLSVSILENWIRAINRKGQAILYGPPGTGKTFVADRLRRHLLSGGDGHSDLVQFHPAYAYEDFIQGLRPVSTSGGSLNYELVPGRFMEFCEQAVNRAGVSVLIIDEINRANLSQVFGELMYLLEYRERQIPLAGGKFLKIPPNVRIIGTMNTADRSIALVDHALRRRFSFIRLAPNMDVLSRFHSERGLDVSALISVLESLNERIADPHYSVGISFFMRDRLFEELEGIWTGEIEPYIEELFFDRLADVEAYRWSKVRERVLA